MWKPINEYNGKYEASDTGEVRNTQTGRILSKYLSNGYYKVGLIVNGKTVVRSIHRLVAMAFLGDRPVDFQGYPFVVNHIDGNKLNNNLENLEYISTWANTTHYHFKLKPNLK